MKRLLIPFLALMIGLPVMAENIDISVKDLPGRSQKIIAMAFPDTNVKKATIEKRASLVQYEVRLSGGIKLQFSKTGALTECTCTKGAVPAVLIPEKISEMVSRDYPGNLILSIEHDSKLYEIVLDNGVELSFNSSLRLISADYPEKNGQ